MAYDIEINGLLKYENEIRAFSFYKDTLKILRIDGVTHECSDDIIMAENMVTIKDEEYKDIKWFCGITNDTRRRIIFFIRGSYGFEAKYNVGIQKYGISSYILYEDNRKVFPISNIKLTGKEIDYFFPYGSGEYEFESDKLSGIKFSSNTKSITKSFTFGIDDSNFSCSLEIEQTAEGSRGIKSRSCLFISVSDSTDFICIVKSYKLVERFFQFICYRKNICFDNIELYGISEGGKRILIAKMFFPEDVYKKPEIEEVLKKTVAYSYIESHIADIFNALVRNEIPFYHIPADNDDRRIIDSVKFISNLSVFERVYKLCFEDILSAKRKEAIITVLSDLKEMNEQKKYGGKKKEELNRIEEHLTKRLEQSNTTLFEKIKKALNETQNILECFIKHVYALNKKEFNDNQNKMIAEYISNHRNDIAHGNAIQGYEYDALYDLNIIEWLNYSLVLKHSGYSDDEVFNIINAVFGRGFVPRQVATIASSTIEKITEAH